MAGMPTRQLTLSHAATDSSETPATAFAGTGLGAGLNAIIDDAKGTAVKVGSGASSPSRGKVLVGSGQVDADSNQQSIWVPYQGKNLIANGTGRTKQRTTMPTTDNSYAIDRMRLLMEQTNGWTISQETSTLPTAPGAQYGFRFTVGAGSAGKGGGFWPVVAADMAEVAGGVLSLQANIYISNARLTNMRIGIAQFTGTADAISGDPVSTWNADGTNPTLAANWSFASTPASLALAATTFGAKYAENVAISSSAKNVAMLVWCDGRSINAADFFIVTDIQCERSAVCTSVERVPEPIERVLALAWYEEFGGDNSAEPFDQAQCFSTTQAIAVVSYFPKRIAPAFSMSAATDFSITQSNASTTALTTLTLGVASKRRASLVATVGSAVLAAGNASRLAANTTNARLQFSSEP
jgi:hypothetical protein